MSPSPLDFSRQLSNNYWNGRFIFGWEWGGGGGGGGGGEGYRDKHFFLVD